MTKSGRRGGRGQGDAGPADAADARRPEAGRPEAQRPRGEVSAAGRSGAGLGRSGRPHFTGRAAVLAVVLCAVALSLAYPVREYLAQRRQIDMLLAQRQDLGQRLHRLEQEQARLKDPAFIEQQARDRLHMCLPTEMCYVIINPANRRGQGIAARQAATPWYGRLWSSVQQANAQPTARQRGKAGQG